MTEPISAVAGAAVAGTGAALLSSLGLEPAPLFWALVGSSIGMTFAAATSRVRAMVVFVAVVLVCSLFGAWLAQHVFAGEALSRNAIACGLALIFHPMLNAVVTRIPAAVDGFARRWFGAGSKP